MNNRNCMMLCIFLMGFLLSTGFAQSWEKISPPGFNVTGGFDAIPFPDGSYEVHVWNSETGFMFSDPTVWDSTRTAYKFICDPIYGEYRNVVLVDIDVSPINPAFSLSTYTIGGCIVECICVFAYDSTGTREDKSIFKGFDDTFCQGIYSSVSFSRADPQIAYICWADSIFKSEDGGKNFFALTDPDTTDFLPISTGIYPDPENPDIVYLTVFSTKGNTLYKSSDGGINWKSILVSGSNIRPNAFLIQPNNRNSLIAGTPNGLYKSMNGGIDWEIKYAENIYQLTVDAANPNRLFASSGFAVLISEDLGETWRIYNNSIPGGFIRGLYNPANTDTLFVATYEGVYSVFAEQVVGIENENNPADIHSITLFPNYPNPFNPSTTLRFELQRLSEVLLQITDISGRHVRTLINDARSAGLHEVRWDGRDDVGNPVASGVYISRLESRGVVQSRKLLLIR